MRFYSVLTIILTIAAANSARGKDVVRANGFVLTTTTEGVRVEENGERVLFYQSRTKRTDGETPYPRSHYVHPVYDLMGQVITEDFPKDHRHHRGIFWAWHQVLVGEIAAGDPWLCKDFDWDVQSVSTAVEKKTAVINAVAIWSSPKLKDNTGKSSPIVKDRVQIRVYPRKEDSRSIDFTIHLTALLPGVRIGGSDDTKGYGGFSTRMRMPSGLRFSSKIGAIAPTKNAISAANWMTFQSDDFSYAILTSDKNPGDSNQWILRQKRSMQNPVYPGRKPVDLKQDAPTILRYRVVILKGGDRDYDIRAMREGFE